MLKISIPVLFLAFLTLSIILRKKLALVKSLTQLNLELGQIFARKQIIDGWPMSNVKESMELQENQYFEEYLNGFHSRSSSCDVFTVYVLQ